MIGELYTRKRPWTYGVFERSASSTRWSKLMRTTEDGYCLFVGTRSKCEKWIQTCRHTGCGWESGHGRLCRLRKQGAKLYDSDFKQAVL